MPFMNFNLGLKGDLRDNLFGQHLVESVVLKAVKAHMNRKDPKKALVMAFHGDTGSGKNHVSKIITRNMFKESSNSKFSHLYIGTNDFPYSDDVKRYKDKLKKEIEEKTKLCERSLFIFDEIDKIPPGVLDVLTPYLDYHESVRGVDYRKNIFIFLSNAGAINITRVALDFWADGKTREDITLKDLEHLVNKGAFNEKGGLQHSDIVTKELIDVYVPFLPLEKKHIKECIISELKRQNLRGDVNMIANQLEYFPAEMELFSVYGCKKVAAKIDIYAS
ncbi:torsin-1A isoform X2 [Parasteatoda tepidariorum]|uniref:torsin-1A isoform X2 n=1 Tax=Parasteatoda tepidariorum TaxID=114398 RepID=UPI0039BC9AE7